MCVARHAQITKNNKFAISLQYFKKEVSDEVGFFHADKLESFLQIDTMIFDGGWSGISKVPKIASLQCLYNISKSKSDEVDFLHADKHQSFLQVDFNTLGIKVSCMVIVSLLMGIKHSQCAQSNKFAIYLQSLKKEVSQKAFQ